MSLPTNSSFAEEIKTDRLKLLNYFVMIMGVTLLLGLLTFGSLNRANSTTSIVVTLAVIIMLAGSTLSNYLLPRQPFTISAWLFVLSPMIAMGLLISQLGAESLTIVPFVFPLIVFIGGLLLSPISTFYLSILSTVVIFGTPMLNGGNFLFTPSQIFAIILTYLAAALAALVTGELYQVTQWALDNYSRERRTNEELFDKRQALQRTLKRAEILGEQLQDTNQNLEIAHDEAEEAKHFRGQFLANMSHELRTPLNAIIGFSETMLQFPIMYDDNALPDAYEKDLSQIYNSGRQLLHVINDILDLAKVDAGKLEIHIQETEPTAIINAVMSTARGLLGKKSVKLQSELPDPMPNVMADESRLRQVLLNLYSNACKYTDEGSIKLKVTELADSKEIQFELTDTGIGIDSEFHETLFEEFQQAKTSGRDPRSGSGLGLAISRQLLELMNGRIWMESTPGKGSSFYFTIQKFEKNAEPDTKQPPDEMDSASQIPQAEGVTE